MRAKDLFCGTGRWVVTALALALLLSSSLAGIAVARPLQPPNPSVDFPYAWGAGSTFADIALAFNGARAQENTDPNTSGEAYVPMPNLVMPPEATWNTMSDNDKAVWLINQERAVRNLVPMEGWTQAASNMGQAWTDYLLANDFFDHDDPTIPDPDPTTLGNRAPTYYGTCWSWVGENLYWQPWAAVPVEAAIYNWIYDDSSSAWHHREYILRDTYSDNACLAGQEGFLGIGRTSEPAGGGTYQGADVAEIVGLEMFDPCGTWDPCGPTAAGLSCLKTAPVEGLGMLVGLVCLGVLASTGFMAQHRRRKG
jgi:uncharacterized protein YkwD